MSETTAELFNAGGISRVFGRPRILEIVAWEDDDDPKEKSLVIGTLRDALRKKAWYSKYDDVELKDYDLPALDIPSLSLNKGIKRRGQVWFYCAAVLGCLLQTVVIIYATFTVFIKPDDFQHNDKPVPVYAFPFFILGTALLSTGMFLCAFIIERSSKEYYFYAAKPSKIYWLQPGCQNVGDQVFGAFMGVNEGRYSQMTKDLTYIKSTKSSKYTENMTVLILTISLTGIGFVIQFVGLRGLHPSVIMAQMGATLIMSIIRTCLRTKRINAKENQLSNNERDLTSHNQQELDCFAFHLENIESFELLSRRANNMIDSQYTFDSETSIVGDSSEYTAQQTNIIRIRTRLAELTSGINKPPNMVWNDLPIRRIAQNLARTIEMTMDLLSTWEPKPARLFDFKLGFRCQPLNRESAEPMEDGSIRLACFHASRPIVDYHTIRLQRSDDNLRWKLNENELEAILGLWTWSLLQSDENWLQKGLGRLIGLDEAEARTENADLYFHKWIYRQTEARMVPSKMIHPATHLFGFYSDDLPDNREVLVVKTQNGLENMAAQDIYIRFLDAICGDLDHLGGTVDVLPGSQGTLFSQSNRVDELVACFESGNLGSREDALLCIVPVLRRQNLLPELAADSPDIRKRIKQYVESDKWTEAFLIVRWLCERCDGMEFERSVFELGYLCRRAMLHNDSRVRKIGFGEVCNILKGDVRAAYFGRLRGSRKAGWMRSRRQSDWWDTFSKQLGWCAWHLAEQGPDRQHFQSALGGFGIKEDSIPSYRFNGNGVQTEEGRTAYLLWLSYKENLTLNSDSDDSLLNLAFDWARLDNHEFLLHCLLLVWMEFGKKEPGFLHNAILLMAARCRLRAAIQTMVRLGLDINLPDPVEGQTPLIQAALENDTGAVQELINNGAEIDGKSPNGETALTSAAYYGNCNMVKFLLQLGASINAQDDNGITALIWATSSNQIDIIKMLLASGADIERAGSNGCTPLLIAVEQNHLDVIELLLQHGANPDVQIDDGSTPIMGAIRSNVTEPVKILLRWDADLYKRARGGETALEMAKSRGHFEIASILEDAMGDIANHLDIACSGPRPLSWG